MRFPPSYDQMRVWHATNSALNGHLLVAWPMVLGAIVWLWRGNLWGFAAVVCGALALAAAHYASGRAFEGQNDISGPVIVCAVLTAFAWVALIAAALLI